MMLRQQIQQGGISPGPVAEGSSLRADNATLAHEHRRGGQTTDSAGRLCAFLVFGDCFWHEFLQMLDARSM